MKTSPFTINFSPTKQPIPPPFKKKMDISNTVLLTILLLFHLQSKNPSLASSLTKTKVQQQPFFSVFQIPSEEDISSEENKSKSCNLNKTLLDEIRSYKSLVNTIFQTALQGSFKGRTYNELGTFVDRFGSRLAGTENLENSIDYMLDKFKEIGLDNVHGENVSIPHWVRGEESAQLLHPNNNYRKTLSILGLGYSVGTPGGLTLTAPAIVVKSFQELKSRAGEVKDKIVIYNEPYISYGETVKYRGMGAVEAAKLGAVGALIRSVTPFSINSPHTGMLDYQENVTKIPAACITIEDAEMLQRMADRGENLTIQLRMNAKMLPNAVSRNVVAEIRGHEKPEEVVIVSGHIDSWDVGQGAMDDGGGMMISAITLSLLKQLNLQPRRTMRAVLWTSEEFGLIGAQEYVKRHGKELSKIIAAFESDIGTFRPLGLDFSGTDEAGCIVQEVLALFSQFNTTKYRKMDEVGSDIGYLIEKGVPGISLNTENERYFWFHHSEGDMLTVQDSGEMDLCTAVWAAASYVLADLSVALPR